MLRPTLLLTALVAVLAAQTARADVAPEVPEATFLESPTQVIVAGSALSIGVALFGLVLLRRQRVSVRSWMIGVLLLGVATGGLAFYASNARDRHNAEVRQILDDWKSAARRRDKARREGEPPAQPASRQPDNGGEPRKIEPPEIDLPSFD